MSSQPHNSTPQPGELPSTAPSTADFRPDGASAPSQVVRPLFPTGFRFEEETRQLLRQRLLLCHAVPAFVLLCLLLVAWSGAESAFHGASKTIGAVFYILLLLHATIGSAVLRRHPRMRMQTLRGMELALVANSMLLLSVMQFDAFLSYSADSLDPRFARTAVERTSLATAVPIYFSIMYYGVLIPNTRRRGLAMVCGMGTLPLLGISLAALFNPALPEFAAFILAMNVLGMFLAGAAAVFSAARIHTLQRQAYKARCEAQQVGPYVLKRLLGKGGMGEVYLAEHKLLKRPCAVKLIRPELSADPQSVTRFVREVQAVTGLNHLNTVRVYDYGRADDGAFYYVMEYLDGQTLDALVHSEGPLAPGRMVYLFRQVCGALAEAHAAGMVHRDLKPGNIFVATLGGQRDIAKLLDFGLVQDRGALSDEGRLTRTGTVLGTPAFMSPEQAGGEPALDGRVDIYSLGATAFFAVTGRPPFDGASVGKLLSAHLTQIAPRADQVRSEVPVDVADVIARCLAKAPADRFQTAEEVAAALARCQCAADWRTAVVHG